MHRETEPPPLLDRIHGGVSEAQVLRRTVQTTRPREERPVARDVVVVGAGCAGGDRERSERERFGVDALEDHSGCAGGEGEGEGEEQAEGERGRDGGRGERQSRSTRCRHPREEQIVYQIFLRIFAVRHAHQKGIAEQARIVRGQLLRVPGRGERRSHRPDARRDEGIGGVGDQEGGQVPHRGLHVLRRQLQFGLVPGQSSHGAECAAHLAGDGNGFGLLQSQRRRILHVGSVAAQPGGDGQRHPSHLLPHHMPQLAEGGRVEQIPRIRIPTAEEQGGRSGIGVEDGGVRDRRESDVTVRGEGVFQIGRGGGGAEERRRRERGGEHGQPHVLRELERGPGFVFRCQRGHVGDAALSVGRRHCQIAVRLLLPDESRRRGLARLDTAQGWKGIRQTLLRHPRRMERKESAETAMENGFRHFGTYSHPSGELH
mmetsp:Transcript_4276/g.8219  ORF Transcript_4276/g.8219 Transcript_4276/m.8219 type:complete len:430 (-) Transcript_4276:7889-9178(-)